MKVPIDRTPQSGPRLSSSAVSISALITPCPNGIVAGYVEVAPGTAMVATIWMTNAVGVRRHENGRDAVTVTALIDLHQFLYERGFRGWSRGDFGISRTMASFPPGKR
jgi:hypothetical protein